MKNPGSHNLSLQIYDVDAFSSNDFLGDACLNLSLPIKDATESNKPVKVNKKYYDNHLSQYMDGEALEFESDEIFSIRCQEKDGAYAGQIRVSLDIVPYAKAMANNVGKGRTEPNHSPYLPPPTGRLHWSWNPFNIIA